MEEREFKIIKKSFSDICQGFSRTNYKAQNLYIKHFSDSDYNDLEDEYEIIFNSAKERGLQVREEKIAFLKDVGEVDIAAMDIKMEELRVKIEDEKSRKSKLFLTLDIKKSQIKIETLTDEYNELSRVKEGFLTDTCEYYADAQMNYVYLRTSLFLDDKLTIPLWSKEDFDSVSRSEISEVSSVYAEALGKFNEKAIKRISVSDHSMNYWRIAGKSAFNLFGKPICGISRNQFNISIYLQIFSNIFENCKNIPEAIKGDADKILDFYNGQNNSKEIIDKEGDGISITGATKEDYENMGLNESNSVFAHDIIAKAALNPDGTRRTVIGFDEVRKLFG